MFDKTGTLTKGKFGVSEIKKANDNFDEKKIIKFAASLEQDSEHPIAKGFLEKADEMEIKLSKVKNFENIKGEGVKGKVDEKDVRIVSPGYLKDKKIEIPSEIKSNDKDGTEVYLLIDEKIVGSIILSDEIRKESYEAVKQLKKQNIKCWMLTGDTESVAKNVSEELKLDGFFAEVLPDEKQEKIKELQKKGEFVSMAGDGVNDAPALAQADVGIAIGSGTDIAAETADIVLVNSNPKDVLKLIKFGKKTYQKMIQNLFWATGYNVIAIPLAAGVLYNQGIIISPAVGAALMSASTIIVAINAKLLST